MMVLRTAYVVMVLAEAADIVTASALVVDAVAFGSAREGWLCLYLAPQALGIGTLSRPSQSKQKERAGGQLQQQLRSLWHQAFGAHHPCPAFRALPLCW